MSEPFISLSGLKSGVDESSARLDGAAMCLAGCDSDALSLFVISETLSQVSTRRDVSVGVDPGVAAAR